MQAGGVEAEMVCNAIGSFLESSVEIWHFWSAGVL